MATIFYEGFDKYGPSCATIGNVTGNSKDVSVALTQNEWTTVFNTGVHQGTLTIVPGLSETGFALCMLSEFGPILSKTLPASYGRLIGGFRFLSSLQALAGCAFYDSLNPQVTITVNQLTGLITIYGGTSDTGTILGQSLFSVSANTIHFLEFDITFNTGALGSFQVWIDGVSVIAGTGTTQQLSCLPSANVFQLITGSAGSGNSSIMAYDDIYLFDSTTAVNNAPLLANPRIETQFPIGDTIVKGFTNNGNIIGVAYSNQGPQGSESNPGANQLILRKFTPNVNCTLDGIGIIPGALGTNATARYKGVVYSDSAGAPNALLSSGTQTIGTLALVPFVAELTSPQALTAGTPYWIGVICNSAVFLSLEDVVTTNGFAAANAYGSGAPNPAPTMTANQPSYVFWGQCSGATVNWASEAVNPPPGDIASIISSTINAEDLYQFAALSTDVITVFGMAVKGNAKVVATGTRTINLQTTSGSTDSPGNNPGQTPSTNYGWYSSYFDTDPNGAIPWTPTAITNSVSGPKVAS